MSPKITIILPFYNTGDYIKETLSDVINQTYSDFECLCIDNASTDNTYDVCKEVCSEVYRNILPFFDVIVNRADNIIIQRRIDIRHGIVFRAEKYLYFPLIFFFQTGYLPDIFESILLTHKPIRIIAANE